MWFCRIIICQAQFSNSPVERAIQKPVGNDDMNPRDAPCVLLVIAGIAVVIFGFVIAFHEQGDLFGGLLSIGTGAVIAIIGVATMGHSRRRR
jgi:hypothetical protein